MFGKGVEFVTMNCAIKIKSFIVLIHFLNYIIISKFKFSSIRKCLKTIIRFKIVVINITISYLLLTRQSVNEELLPLSI